MGYFVHKPLAQPEPMATRLCTALDGASVDARHCQRHVGSLPSGVGRLPGVELHDPHELLAAVMVDVAILAHHTIRGVLGPRKTTITGVCVAMEEGGVRPIPLMSCWA